MNSELLIPAFVFFFWWTDVQSCKPWRRKRRRWEMKRALVCPLLPLLSSSIHFFFHCSCFLLLHMSTLCSVAELSIQYSFRDNEMFCNSKLNIPKYYIYIYNSFFKKIKKKIWHCLVVCVSLLLAHISTCSLHLPTAPSDPRFPSHVSWVASLFCWER